MEKTRLSNKGQIVTPKAVRLLHGWKPGLEFVTVSRGEKNEQGSYNQN